MLKALTVLHFGSVANITFLWSLIQTVCVNSCSLGSDIPGRVLSWKFNLKLLSAKKNIYIYISKSTDFLHSIFPNQYFHTIMTLCQVKRVDHSDEPLEIYHQTLQFPSCLWHISTVFLPVVSVFRPATSTLNSLVPSQSTEIFPVTNVWQTHGIIQKTIVLGSARLRMQ